MNPSLRGIRVLNNYLLWNRILDVVKFPMGIVFLASIFFYGPVYFFSPGWLCPEFFVGTCALLVLVFRPVLIYHGVPRVPRWDGKFFREGERITLLWKSFRIDLDRSEIVAATHIFWEYDPGVLVLDVALPNTLDGEGGAYRERGDFPEKSLKNVRVTLPLQGEGGEEVLSWIREFPRLREKKIPRQ
jgi:hypothetical protein